MCDDSTSELIRAIEVASHFTSFDVDGVQHLVSAEVFAESEKEGRLKVSLSRTQDIRISDFVPITLDIS